MELFDIVKYFKTKTLFSRSGFKLYPEAVSQGSLHSSQEIARNPQRAGNCCFILFLLKLFFGFYQYSINSISNW